MRYYLHAIGFAICGSTAAQIGWEVLAHGGRTPRAVSIVGAAVVVVLGQTAMTNEESDG